MWQEQNSPGLKQLSRSEVLKSKIFWSTPPLYTSPALRNKASWKTLQHHPWTPRLSLNSLCSIYPGFIEITKWHVAIKNGPKKVFLNSLKVGLSPSKKMVLFASLKAL